MLILRPSVTLARRLRITPDYVAPKADEQPLAEWCARDFQMGTRRLVLFMNPATTLPVVLSAAPYASLVARFCNFLPGYLAELGWNQSRETLGPIFAKGVEFRRGTDRSSTGLMNQLLLDLKADHEYGLVSMDNMDFINRRLLETLIGGSRPEGYKEPIERFREWIGAVRPTKRILRLFR